MSQVFFIADPHLGHKNIHKMRTACYDAESNTEMFLKEATAKLNKRCLTFFLGDVAFDRKHLDMVATLPGRKILVKGNHDNLTSTADQLDVFEQVHGLYKYKQYWLSHCPIHPKELRGKINIHGHVHYATINDCRYINMCPEEQGQYITSLDEVREWQPHPETITHANKNAI